MNITELSKEELMEILNKKEQKEAEKKQKVRTYIAKYQKTDKGIKKSREANNKYYYANREAILKKKKEQYLQRKELKQTQ